MSVNNICNHPPRFHSKEQLRHKYHGMNSHQAPEHGRVSCADHSIRNFNRSRLDLITLTTLMKELSAEDGLDRKFFQALIFGGVETYWYVMPMCRVRRPATWLGGKAFESSSSSSLESWTPKEAMFESRLAILVVPGIGTTSAPWCCTHARASWFIVHRFLSAICFTRSRSFSLVFRFSPTNRGAFFCTPSQEL